jgi:phosphatidylglycerol:prolipoprotein diacylglycerol transferase
MLHDLIFKIYQFLFHYVSNELMMILSFLIAFVMFSSLARTVTEKLKSIFLVSVIAFSAFFGARILHVFIEQPSLFKTPQLIFQRYDGMTFNGSLLFGFVALCFGLLIFKKEERLKYWDMTAIVTALSYGLLRIGCFTNGCCWGKISSVPWTIKYFKSNVMPWRGIPVHPVQLYDALLGFSLCALLIFVKFKFKKSEGFLIQIFLVVYSIGRFFTEYFRGDSIRGEDILFHLSTSQLVSIGIILVLAIWNWKKQHLYMIRNMAATIGLSILITGCIPQAPSDSDFRAVQRDANFEIYQTFKSSHSKQKNVIFVAGDDNIQSGFAQILKSTYKTNTVPKLEDIVFWEYIKDMKNIYNIILKIPKENIGKANLIKSLEYMEALNRPYDLILLTHGMPNYLSTGKYYFFSFREIDALKGRLPNLNIVMLQSCFGQSLSEDFKQAGAKFVLSYPEFNRNFFFFGFFLKYYQYDFSVDETYQLAKSNFIDEMKTPLYAQISNLLFLQFNNSSKKKVTKYEFLHSMPAPVLDY